MVDLGFGGQGIETVMMDANLLNVDRKYQREAIPAHVANIAANWNPDFYNAPLVSFRADGSRFVMDGNNTRLAAIKRAENLGGKGSPAFIPVRLYYGLTLEQEAEYFVKFNGNSTPVNKNGKFKSRAASGDKTANSIINAVESVGLRVNLSTRSITDHKTIGAIGGLEDIYALGGAPHLTDTLTVLHLAFTSNKAKLSKNMMKGMSAFLLANPTVDRESFIRQLFKFAVKDIDENAAKRKRICGNTVMWVEVSQVLQIIHDNPEMTPEGLDAYPVLPPVA